MFCCPPALGRFPRFESFTTHGTPSSRQLVHWLPQATTSQRTFLVRQERQATVDRRLVARSLVESTAGRLAAVGTCMSAEPVSRAAAAGDSGEAMGSGDGRLRSRDASSTVSPCPRVGWSSFNSLSLCPRPRTLALHYCQVLVQEMARGSTALVVWVQCHLGWLPSPRSPRLHRSCDTTPRSQQLQPDATDYAADGAEEHTINL